MDNDKLDEINRKMMSELEKIDKNEDHRLHYIKQTDITKIENNGKTKEKQKE